MGILHQQVFDGHGGPDAATYISKNASTGGQRRQVEELGGYIKDGYLKFPTKVIDEVFDSHGGPDAATYISKNASTGGQRRQVEELGGHIKDGYLKFPTKVIDEAGKCRVEEKRESEASAEQAILMKIIILTIKESIKVLKIEELGFSGDPRDFRHRTPVANSKSYTVELPPVLTNEHEPRLLPLEEKEPVTNRLKESNLGDISELVSRKSGGYSRVVGAEGGHLPSCLQFLGDLVDGPSPKSPYLSPRADDIHRLKSPTDCRIAPDFVAHVKGLGPMVSGPVDDSDCEAHLPVQPLGLSHVGPKLPGSPLARPAISLGLDLSDPFDLDHIIARFVSSKIIGPQFLGQCPGSHIRRGDGVVSGKDDSTRPSPYWFDDGEGDDPEGNFSGAWTGSHRRSWMGRRLEAYQAGPGASSVSRMLAGSASVEGKVGSTPSEGVSSTAAGGSGGSRSQSGVGISSQSWWVPPVQPDFSKSVGNALPLPRLGRFWAVDDENLDLPIAIPSDSPIPVIESPSRVEFGMVMIVSNLSSPLDDLRSYISPVSS
ncbi:hypothetical protein HHK36_031778 [Tetracentron sinense]|uniref:Uncharacterized protein n=1 Tax=Tetracentron sinense TaxID=13715 RepID=A0A835CY93_TETSI|nr:hypothetical protein HHK36_031778 [Tetracentron sinense]